MGRKGKSGMTSSSGAGSSGGFTSSEMRAINGDPSDLRRNWLGSDEEWAESSDPYDVAAEIINFEERGRGWDVSIDDKLGDFGDSFKDPDSNAARRVAIKLTEESNRNLLNNPDIKREYDRIKREGF